MVDANTKEEAFFGNLKDQIELLKVLALAMGMVTAAHVVALSQIEIATRLVGAMTCMVLGVWIGICGVVVYFRHRLKLRGRGLRTKIWRIFQYLTIMGAMLYAFSIGAQLAKLSSR